MTPVFGARTIGCSGHAAKKKSASEEPVPSGWGLPLYCGAAAKLFLGCRPAARLNLFGPVASARARLCAQKHGHGQGQASAAPVGARSKSRSRPWGGQPDAALTPPLPLILGHEPAPATAVSLKPAPAAAEAAAASSNNRKEFEGAAGKRSGQKARKGSKQQSQPQLADVSTMPHVFVQPISSWFPDGVSFRGRANNQGAARRRHIRDGCLAYFDMASACPARRRSGFATPVAGCQ